MDEYGREPCPWRIVDDAGGAFTMGLIGGGVFQAIKGFRNAPSGYGRRLQGSFIATRTRAPFIGGQFAAWGGVFSIIDCSLSTLRKKDDPWNSIMSGAATGGILAARSGPAGMAGATVMGGMILAMIEGMSVLITRFTAEQFNPLNTPQEPPPDPSVLDNNAASSPLYSFQSPSYH